VKLLLDHCVPKPFGRLLFGHEVKTAYQMDWANLGNGKLLLAAATERFDAFITVDLNIRYQQNLSRLPLPVIALVAIDNDLETLRPYGAFVIGALSHLEGKHLRCIHADGRIEIVKHAMRRRKN
jgi:hypothetical protein